MPEPGEAQRLIPSGVLTSMSVLLHRSRLARVFPRLGAYTYFTAAFAVILLGGIILFVRMPAPEKPWEAATAIATWASVLALLAAAWVAMRQLSQLRAAYQVDAFIRAADSIDSDLFKKGLGKILDLEPTLHDRDSLLEYYQSLSATEAEAFWEHVGIVGNTIERIGAMIEYGALDRKMILDYIAPTIVQAYYALEFRWRDRSPGEGWVFMDRLASAAISYLDDVVRSQPDLRFIDTEETRDLSVSVQVEMNSGSVQPYRFDGTERCYRLLTYVKNSTKRRIRAYADIELDVTLPYRFRAHAKPGSEDEGPAPASERLPAGSRESNSATLSIAPGKCQRIASFFVEGPGGGIHRSPWRIKTHSGDERVFEGFIDVRYGTEVNR